MADDTPRPTILVVDDTPDNLKVMSGLLRDRYRVKVANNGRKALELAAAGAPDLVLLDVMMPEMDGHEVCRRLKADPATRAVPVIFLTARAEAGDEEAGFRLGAVDYITKPISPPVVLARVATHLALKAAHDEAAAARDRAETALAELTVTQEQLIEAGKQAALTGLVAGIAHEINTPVGIALTAATTLDAETAKLRQAVEEGRAKKSHVAAFLDVAAESARLITRHCANAADLIRSFKMMAVDQSRDEPRTLDLAGYLEDVAVSLRPELRKTRVALEVRCPPGLAVEIRPGALGQILTNLVMNALTHAFDEGRREGRITIAAAEAGDGLVEIRHVDDGCGVPAAIAGRIFEPFFTTRRGRGGSGLGLGIVYSLATRTLGGSVRLEPTPGGGATFVIIVPKHSPKV